MKNLAKNFTENSIWLLLFAVVFASFLWFFTLAATKLYTYYSLDETKEAVISEWFTEETTAGEFNIGATYSFEVNGKTYRNETVFSAPKFRNPSSADDELKGKPNKLLAFYSSSNADFSSLQKTFPLKECISAFVLLALVFYFIGLKKYAERKF